MARNERNIKLFTLYDLFSYQVLICHQNGKLTRPILEVTVKSSVGFPAKCALCRYSKFFMYVNYNHKNY